MGILLLVFNLSLNIKENNYLTEKHETHRQLVKYWLKHTYVFKHLYKCDLQIMKKEGEETIMI